MGESMVRCLHKSSVIDWMPFIVMSWIIYAFATIFCYSLFDLFIKLSSSKMHSSVNGIIVNIVALVIGIIYFVYAKAQGEKVLIIKQGGLVPAVLAGIVVGFAGIFLVKMFASDVNLSFGTPVVRIGSVVLASLLGVLILREGLNARYLFGFVLSLAGLVLIFTAK